MKALAAIPLVMFVTACQAPRPEMTEAEYDGIVTAVVDVTDAMTDAWNAFDVDASMSFFHPEKTSFAWGSTVYDFAGLRERWTEIWATANGQETSWTGRKIEVLSENAVLFQGSLELRIFYSDGRVVLYPGTAHWTTLLEPLNGQWRITYGSYAYGGAQTVEGG